MGRGSFSEEFLRIKGAREMWSNMGGPSLRASERA